MPNEHVTVRDIAKHWIRDDKIDHKYLRFYIRDRSSLDSYQWPTSLKEEVPKDYEVLVELPSLKD